MNSGPPPEYVPDAGRDGVPAVSGAVSPPRGSDTVGTGPVPSAAVSVAGLVFDDPLDRPSSDDTDRGWGESSPGTADDDFTRFLNEKPPHHL